MHAHTYTALHKKQQCKMLIFDEIQEMNGQPSNMLVHFLSFAFFFQFFHRTPSTIQQNKEPLHCIVSL